MFTDLATQTIAFTVSQRLVADSRWNSDRAEYLQ